MKRLWKILSGICKGVLILTFIILVGITLQWYITNYSDMFIIIVKVIAICAIVYLLYVSGENLYKLFDSWWHDRPPGFT